MRSIRLWSAALACAAVLVAACGEQPFTVCDPTDTTCNPTDPTDTTGTQTPALEVLVVDPTDGATGVALDKTVTVTFNRPVDVGTVTGTSFQVAGATGTVAANGATATFTPSVDYSDGTPMQVTVNGVTDANGVPMASSFTSSFTTRTLALMVDAGPNFDASADSMITLDKGSSSGSGATFTWAQIAGPSVGPLTGESPTFPAPDEVTKLSFELTGANASGSQVDTVDIWVLEDANHAIWVSANTGSPSGDGSRSAPLTSIQAGIDAADNAGNGADVYVAAGNYDESLTLRSRVSVYGGWSDVDWSRDVSTSKPVVSGSATAVLGELVTDVTLDGLEIIAANASGGAGLSSVAVVLDRTADVWLTRNILRAGNGTAGISGVIGATGPKGADGGDGGNGRTCTTNGGTGGAGGADPDTPDGGRGGDGKLGNGDAGSAAHTQWQGGEGGSGGTSGSKNGSNGEDADANGAAGAHGAGGGAFGALTATGYDGSVSSATGSTGSRGGDGYGGGGGGGGHGQIVSLVANYCGGGGGGGGAGGQGGYGGTGGTGGGGSFGVMVLGTATAEVSGNEIHTGAGGAGGSGGLRGFGGAGGDRGDPGARICDSLITSACAGRGGWGGYGSIGGRGGYGGGGGGGPSIGILESADATLTENGNDYTLGGGGSGGFSSGNSGAAGESVNHKKAN